MDRLRLVGLHIAHQRDETGHVLAPERTRRMEFDRVTERGLRRPKDAAPLEVSFNGRSRWIARRSPDRKRPILVRNSTLLPPISRTIWRREAVEAQNPFDVLPANVERIICERMNHEPVRRSRRETDDKASVLPPMSGSRTGYLPGDDIAA